MRAMRGWIWALLSDERRWDRPVVYLACVLGVCAVSSVGAQNRGAAATTATQPPHVSDAAREQARQEFALGLSATEARNWPSAYEHMRRARELNPTSLRILSGLAVAQTNAGMLIEARESYRQWLEQGREQPEEVRADIQRQLNDVERDIPRLSVRVDGLLAGDEFQVDGQPQAVTDEAITINPGRHELTIVRDARVVARGFVELGTAARANYELTAPARVGQTGSLHVTTNNVAADVYVDGVLLGHTPGDFSVSAGRHSVELRAPGFGRLQRMIDVSAQQVLALDLILSRADSRLRIASNVPARAYLDGYELGAVPGAFDVPIGVHTVEVRAEGYGTYRRDLTFQSGEERSQDVTLLLGSAIAPPGGGSNNTVAWVTGISIAVAVVAGVVVYFAVIEPTNRDTPYQGNLGGPIYVSNP